MYVYCRLLEAKAVYTCVVVLSLVECDESAAVAVGVVVEFDGVWEESCLSAGCTAWTGIIGVEATSVYGLFGWDCAWSRERMLAFSLSARPKEWQ